MAFCPVDYCLQNGVQRQPLSTIVTIKWTSLCSSLIECAQVAFSLHWLEISFPIKINKISMSTCTYYNNSKHQEMSICWSLGEGEMECCLAHAGVRFGLSVSHKEVGIGWTKGQRRQHPSEKCCLGWPASFTAHPTKPLPIWCVSSTRPW